MAKKETEAQRTVRQQREQLIQRYNYDKERERAAEIAEHEQSKSKFQKLKEAANAKKHQLQNAVKEKTAEAVTKGKEAVKETATAAVAKGKDKIDQMRQEAAARKEAQQQQQPQKQQQNTNNRE